MDRRENKTGAQKYDSAIKFKHNLDIDVRQYIESKLLILMVTKIHKKRTVFDAELTDIISLLNFCLLNFLL